MSKPSTSQNAADIAGTAPNEVKQRIADVLAMGGSGFGSVLEGNLDVKEVSIGGNAEEPSKKEARIVCESVVEENMLNIGRTLHGGFVALYIDVCGTFPLIALPGLSGVTLNLNVSYHSPAKLGDKLRIITTTLSNGARVLSTRGEIWNITTKRLVASGVHIKMEPSAPKL
ncbi:hypothetical protein BV25DRAFT_582 [Artomyces pyxidatus]|uniref:Uncharacterized protein n=1 Tax=Artomyces pyxidatus TaxID=48021 RepID=A0ACB8TJ73_9AGAM|nr:hypothetical protein BV25DRAFT_582 [Artomyces pyxidatus]